TDEGERDDEPEIWAVDFEPPSTDVVCGNICCGGFDGAQDGETAERSAFKNNHSAFTLN
ncbi:hypothetical protein K443DRAFT_682235, partial [Laccaria amethystina LaAM-08-1]